MQQSQKVSEFILKETVSANIMIWINLIWCWFAIVQQSHNNPLDDLKLKPQFLRILKKQFFNESGNVGIRSLRGSKEQGTMENTSRCGFFKLLSEAKWIQDVEVRGNLQSREFKGLTHWRFDKRFHMCSRSQVKGLLCAQWGSTRTGPKWTPLPCSTFHLLTKPIVPFLSSSGQY